MDLFAVLDHVREQLQRRGRITYRMLQAQFKLSEDDIEALKAELIDGQHVATDEEGKVLVWTGEEGNGASAKRGNGEGEGVSSQLAVVSAHPPAGERRQLTVLFCDMVGFTELATRVDPEVLQGVIRSYEDACAVCITRYEGYVFQRLGDGIVAFFGYPLAHEGEAERAIHAGLAIIEALATRAVPEVGQL